MQLHALLYLIAYFLLYYDLHLVHSLEEHVLGLFQGASSGYDMTDAVRTYPEGVYFVTRLIVKLDFVDPIIRIIMVGL